MGSGFENGYDESISGGWKVQYSCRDKGEKVVMGLYGMWLMLMCDVRVWGLVVEVLWNTHFSFWCLINYKRFGCVFMKCY